MSASIIEQEDSENFTERRAFPRISVNCPTLYRLETGKRWWVAKMVEYSATGITMICDENLPEGSELDIQIKPGSIKTIPELSVTGKVMRSEANDDQRFNISVKILKVLRNS